MTGQRDESEAVRAKPAKVQKTSETPTACNSGGEVVSGRCTAGAEAGVARGTLAEVPGRRDLLRLVTVNVDGLGEYDAPPSERMEAILEEVLAVSPDVLLLQEVLHEMHATLRQRLPRWKTYRRRDCPEEYFNVTAVRTAPESEADATTCYAFPTSSNGRHVLTVRRGHWAISNLHAESGGRREERGQRCAQLQYLSRMHELEEMRHSVVLPTSGV